MAKQSAPTRSASKPVRPAAAKGSSASAKATADQAVVITHPEKVLFPDDGITKGDLAEYHALVAPLMLPHLTGRPVTMERYPAGIGKQGFWQKSVEKGFPSWLERVDVPKKDGVVHHPIVNDERSLMWIVNQNTITQHVWTSRVPNLYHPDICVFDLDPATDDPAPVRAAAIGLRDLLAELGLPSWVKTSGSKGYHIVVPVDGSRPWRKSSASRTTPAGCSSAMRRIISPRNSTRSIARAAFTSTPGATATAPRSPPRIPS